MLIYQIDAVWPARVSALRRVAKFIQYCGELDAKLAHTRACNRGALVFIFRTGKYYAVFDVALHLPNIARMRLGDIHNQKRDAASVLLVKLVESGNLPPKGRSGVAAKNQDDRLGLIEFRKMHLGRLIQFSQEEIRSPVS